jgi:hypothetical protein
MYSPLFSDLPEVIDKTIHIHDLDIWLRENNIEQGLEVVGCMMSQIKVRSDIEKTIVDEIINELTVLNYVLNYIDTLNKFHYSCWYLSDFRTGSLTGSMTDLVTSLRIINCKLKLISMLRDLYIQ